MTSGGWAAPFCAAARPLYSVSVESCTLRLRGGNPPPLEDFMGREFRITVHLGPYGEQLLEDLAVADTTGDLLIDRWHDGVKYVITEGFTDLPVANHKRLRTELNRPGFTGGSNS